MVDAGGDLKRLCQSSGAILEEQIARGTHSIAGFAASPGEQFRAGVSPVARLSDETLKRSVTQEMTSSSGLEIAILAIALIGRPQRYLTAKMVNYSGFSGTPDTATQRVQRNH